MTSSTNNVRLPNALQVEKNTFLARAITSGFVMSTLRFGRTDETIVCYVKGTKVMNCLGNVNSPMYCAIYGRLDSFQWKIFEKEDELYEYMGTIFDESLGGSK